MKKAKGEMFHVFLGKKAQLGATITWFAAFIVIFFIMTLFIIAILFIGSEQKRISFNKTTILDAQRMLFFLLDSPVDYRLEMLQDAYYYDKKDIFSLAVLTAGDFIGFKKGESISNLDVYYNSLKSGEGKITYKKSIEASNILFSEIKKYISFCDSIVIKAPQGVVYKIPSLGAIKLPEKEDFAPELGFLDALSEEFKINLKEYVLEVPYKNQIIKLKIFEDCL